MVEAYVDKRASRTAITHGTPDVREDFFEDFSLTYNDGISFFKTKFPNIFGLDGRAV